MAYDHSDHVRCESLQWERGIGQRGRGGAESLNWQLQRQLGFVGRGFRAAIKRDRTEALCESQGSFRHISVGVVV